MAQTTFTSQQKQAMLLLIAFMLLLRIFVIPHLDQRTLQQQDLANVTSQWQRAQRAQALENYQQQLDGLTASRKQIQQRFTPFRSDGDFRLRNQQQIEQILANYQVQVDLFDWLGRQQQLDEYLHLHQARIIFSGRTELVLQSQFALLSEIPGLRITEYSMQPQRGRIRSRISRSRVTLLLELPGIQEQTE